MLLYQSKGYQDIGLTKQSSMWSCQTKSATRCFPKRGDQWKHWFKNGRNSLKPNGMTTKNRA